MKQEIKKELEQYVLKQMKNLNKLDAYDNYEEYLSKERSAIENINVLIDLLQKDDVNYNNYNIDDRKLDIENNKNISQHDLELDKLDFEKKKLMDNLDLETDKLNSVDERNRNDIRLKEFELNIKNKVDKTDLVLGAIKIGIEVMAVALPVIQYNSWMKKGFEFEETGTFTSNTFRNMWSRFRPEK
jgi:hypothetical protein